MIKMNKRKNRIVVCLCLLVFMLLIPSLFTLNSSNFDNNTDTTLETSTDNYLFNGVPYDITLDDVYDDENATKIYTGANFQSSSFNTTTYDWNDPENETVSPVNNTNYKSPSNTGVSMINGTFDDTDNMKANDDSYTDFTSTALGDPPNEFIESITYTEGSDGGGSISNTWVDDANSQQIDPKKTWVETFWLYTVVITLVFDPVVGGRDFFISGDIVSSQAGAMGFLKINDVNWKTGADLDFDDDFHAGVNSITYVATLVDVAFHVDIFYFKIVEDTTGPAELNYTVDISFSELDTSDLLAVDVSSHHYTNVSTDIIGSIYNYDSSSYTQMFSSSNTAETLNYYKNDTVPEDFLNSSGNLRLYFTGINSESTFKQIIDYIKVRFYYKMDLSHTISFDVNGMWKYRWELIGSLQYTEWNYFEVIDPIPNFHAISESDYTTRWTLQGADITPVLNFTDDINSDYWNLVDVSESLIILELNPDVDAHVKSSQPSINFGTETYLQCGKTTYTAIIFLKTDFNDMYLYNNITEDGKIDLYQTSIGATDSWVNVYETSSFVETTITYNNQPAQGDYISQTYDTSGYNEWVSLNLSDTIPEYYMFEIDVQDDWKTYSSSEAGSNNPKITYNISKNYFGSGYMYMQTNTTESIALQSIDYTSHYTLSSGDYFQVGFQTSSDSQIDLLLYKDGVLNKSLILSASGNTNFNYQTAQISVDDFVEFDQIKISSTFEDGDNVKVYDIKTYKYTLTGDSANFVVGSRRTESVYLTPDTYSLKISDYSSGHVYVDENVTIGSTDLYKVFTPTATKQCRIAFFNPDNVPLIFTDYHVSINRSLGGSYSQFALLENIFSVDVDTTVYVTISDRFNTLIRTYEEGITPTTDYLDVELEVYSLQIKNLMEQKTTVDINATHTYPLLSGDSIYFILSEAQYVIGYNDTNNNRKQFTIDLNSNQAYELNRSKICFLSYADQQGTHLSFDNYKTYINNSLLYENVFYREIGDSINITIKDRYDIQIHSEIYNVISGDNYIPITLTMYSLKVMSQQLVFNHINITRDSDYYDSDMYWSEWIAPSEIIDFRLFAGYYTINITNVEDSSFSLYDYTLNGDDVILLSSDNTLYNVLYNIANVNTTIGNQITSVEINITNQNSAINNTVVSIVINLDSINSSLGTMLVDIDTAILNINTSIVNEIVSMGTIITNINTSIINQILDIGVNITNMNSTMVSQLLTLGVSIENINGSIIDQIVLLGVDVTNINTTLYNQILSIGVDISNLDTSITNQITSVISNITNVNTTILAQISSLSSDITNVNTTIVNQIVSLGVDITNINTSLSNQILSLEVDITNINSSIIEQILLVIADIENIETVIDDQTLVILSDITNVNSTILNQMALLGLNITNINATIYNQILSLSVDLTNINASISSLLYYMDVDITSIGNNITTFYAFTNTSFINLNNIMNTSFIYMENNIIAINQTISNLVIGVDNSIYLINGTISTMITSLENNLLLMEVSINTALFNLNTTIDIIGANITSNYILLNNTLNIMDTNIDDSRIAMINNLLLVNNTMSTLIANVYSAVYLINNSIYTAVIDLGTYLSLMNNTIDGNLSFILSQNDFLTQIHQMTMFSELLNWTDIGLNTSLLTSQIDAWDFVNNYKNQSITVLLRYNDIIDNLTISAQNTIDQYLPESGAEYREWSEELQDYVGEWTPLPENRTVNFGFYEAEVPIVPRPMEADVLMITAFAGITAVAVVVIAIGYGRSKKEVYETPKKVRKMYKDKNRGIKKETFDQSGL